MRSTPPSLSPRPRHALTLLEVMLTLSLLVILASITLPALERPFASQRLRKSADVVRVQWAKARVRAMSTGQTQAFRHAVEGDRFAVEDWAGPEYSADAADTELEDLSSTEGTASLVNFTEQTLPEGIKFVASEATMDYRGQSLASGDEYLSDTENGWSEPIFFYPDGTTSTARLQLVNEHQRTIELCLRGLTGVVTIGHVRSAEEFSP